MFENNGDSILFPPFRLDIPNEKLWRGADEIYLRLKTFAILRYLAAHSGRLVSKAEILRAIWGETQVNAEGLRDYIGEIRKALNDDAAAPRFVETARGRGYRFVGEVVGHQYPVVSGGKEEGRQPTKTRPLLTIRGVYDGKTFRALPTESLPSVDRETPVAIIFLENEPHLARTDSLVQLGVSSKQG